MLFYRVILLPRHIKFVLSFHLLQQEVLQLSDRIDLRFFIIGSKQRILGDSWTITQRLEEFFLCKPFSIADDLGKHLHYLIAYNGTYFHHRNHSVPGFTSTKYELSLSQGKRDGRNISTFFQLPWWNPLNTFPGKVTEKGDKGTMRVSVDIGIPWDLTTSAQPVHSLMLSVLKWSSSPASSTQDGISPSTSMARRRRRLGTELGLFSCLFALELMWTFSALLRSSSLTSTDLLFTVLRNFGLSASMQQFYQMPWASYDFCGCPLGILKTSSKSLLSSPLSFLSSGQHFMRDNMSGWERMFAAIAQ